MRKGANSLKRQGQGLGDVINVFKNEASDYEQGGSGSLILCMDGSTLALIPPQSKQNGLWAGMLLLRQNIERCFSKETESTLWGVLGQVLRYQYSKSKSSTVQDNRTQIPVKRNKERLYYCKRARTQCNTRPTLTKQKAGEFLNAGCVKKEEAAAAAAEEGFEGFGGGFDSYD